jgi:hypothetical protein
MIAYGSVLGQLQNIIGRLNENNAVESYSCCGIFCTPELARDMNVKPAYGSLSVLGQLQNIIDRLN